MQRFYLNRTLCDVLEEIRKCYETRNFSPLLGLVEEAQSMGNRMEAALADVKDIKKMQERWHELKDELKRLEENVKNLGGEIDGD